MTAPAAGTVQLNDAVTRAASLRHVLHRHPELSGAEDATARRIKDYFAPLQPDEIVDELGGAGLAVCFGQRDNGPQILLRCELDALPIQETNDIPHASQCPRVAHQCGHDGHMAILAAVGAVLAKHRPRYGRVILLYQPAEETGAGANAVISDPQFARVRPDQVYALHNLPGVAHGQIVTRVGTFSCASSGLVIDYIGRTAHAAQPETGISPADAMCRTIALMQALPAGLGGATEQTFATVVGARLGAKAFGTAPADACVMATLRSESDATMEAMTMHVRREVANYARADGLRVDVACADVFAATVNAQAAVERIFAAAADTQIMEQPFRWSEDFGAFTRIAEGAMFGLGAGADVADLHDPEYDFPDTLIATGAQVFLRLLAAGGIRT